MAYPKIHYTHPLIKTICGAHKYSPRHFTTTDETKVTCGNCHKILFVHDFDIDRAIKESNTRLKRRCFADNVEK